MCIRDRSNPKVGTADLTITADGSPNRITAGIVSVTGADTANPFGTAKTTSASSGTPSVTVSAQKDGLVLDTLYRGGGTSTVGSGQTEQWNKVDLSLIHI